MTLAFFLIAAFFAFYALAPFFEKNFKQRKITSGFMEQEDLLYRKEEILTALNDLEYDYKMKKMSDTDYLQLKEKLTQEAIEVMKKLDQMAPPAEVHAVRATARKPKPHKVRS